MGYSIQNFETGETDYIHCDASNIKKQEFDEETGEPLNGKFKMRFVKHTHFQIPKKYLRGSVCDEFEKEMTGDYHESFQPSNIQIKPKTEQEQQYDRDDYINMEGVKNEIILGFNKNNYHIFLILTFFCFNVYMAFFLGLLEYFLHFWTHKKNALNMNKEVFYRSPLHMLTSQFCAVCRSEREMDIHIFDRLNKQMRKARQSKTLKDVTKVFS